MCDLISRQAAIDATKKHYRAHDNDLLELIAFDIEQLPSVQPDIVRCRDCRYYNHEEKECLDLLGYGRRWEEDDYCSYAEREVNNESN